jgi:hypothetical protein
MTITQGMPSLKELEDCFVNNSDLDRISGYRNRFNPIRVMRMEGMEIRHSAILAWLLDPLETHGFDDRFLRAFLAQALSGQDPAQRPTSLEVSIADLRDAEVRREKQNIDLFVSSEKNRWAFVIENKFHSQQHGGQLKRYIDHAEAEAKVSGKEFKLRGIFLTLREEAPSEDAQDSYVTMRYEDICKILTMLMEGGATNLTVEVRQFLIHYLDIIKDAAGMSEQQKEMEALAKALYRKHKTAIDFVIQHGVSTDFTLAVESLFGADLRAGCEISDGERRYMYSWENAATFSFVPMSWSDALGGEARKTPWTGCEKWWAGYPLICWFQLFKGDDGLKGQLRLFAEVGPLADAAARAKLVEVVSTAAQADGAEIQLRADAGKAGTKYSKFFKTTANTVQISDVNDSEAIAQGMKRLLKKFAPSVDAVAANLPEFMTFLEAADE